MSDKQALTFTRSMNVDPAAVYEALTGATGLREWLSDGAVVAASRVGGSYQLWWNDGYYTSGEFTTLTENECVEFTWRGRGEPTATTVRIDLKPADGGTNVAVAHSGYGSDESWGNFAQEITQGWEASLENLQSVLETGTDLRIARRPMLGIIVSQQVTPEIAEKLGLPVTEGVQIGSAIEGMGAEAAGLVGSDVITRLAETPIVNFQSFAEAVAPYHGGDTVEVEFYRGSEKHVVDMTLSKRQLPEVSDDPKELAKQLEAIFDDLSKEIDEIVSGLDDATASQPPAEGEWNVKQVLAHLILSDRSANGWIASLVSGTEQVNFGGNINAQVDAVIELHPTVADLLAELRRTWAEQVAFVSRLEKDFTDRKRTYVRLGQTLLQTAYHPQGHHEQLRDAIAAATVAA